MIWKSILTYTELNTVQRQNIIIGSVVHKQRWGKVHQFVKNCVRRTLDSKISLHVKGKAKNQQWMSMTFDPTGSGALKAIMSV